MNTIRRFHAPTLTGELLAEPSFNHFPALIESNRQLLETDRIRIGDTPLSQFRNRARKELFAAANLPEPTGPLILTGHQPELSHPGVWLKTFAAAGMAERLNGSTLNLVVDTDEVKSLAVRLPVWNADPHRVHVESIAFDSGDADMAYESRNVDDESYFASFPERAKAIVKQWSDHPLLETVWERVVSATGTIGERFVAARSHYEVTWGCRVPPLTVSRVSQTESFQQFATHILSDLPRFISSYNSAIQAYRTKYRLRSQTHPVPELRPEEAPFWTIDQGIRHAASANSPLKTLRPRALTLTLFARLCIGDWFIHGIGGGKYDEVTDSIIRDFYGLEPPAFQVITGTMRLPLPLFPHTKQHVQNLQHALRDLHWNPQRYTDPNSNYLLDEDRDARQRRIDLQTTQTENKADRRNRALEIRMLNERLRPFVNEQRSIVERNYEIATQDAHANAILQNREYAWILYSEPTLRDFLQSAMKKAGDLPG